MTDINLDANRFIRYQGGAIQFDLGASVKQIKFVKNMDIILDDSDIEVSRIDTGVPIFTPIGDETGDFKFDIFDTVDMYDTVNPPTNLQTISYFLDQISKRTFPVLSFISVKAAPNGTTNKFARIKFDGRIKKVTLSTIEDKALESAVIEGRITKFTSALAALT